MEAFSVSDIDIEISEVGPRDGLQSIAPIMATEDKKRWITALAAAGIGGFANFMAMSVILGLATGVQAIASRRLGEGRRPGCRRIVFPTHPPCLPDRRSSGRIRPLARRTGRNNTMRRPELGRPSRPCDGATGRQSRCGRAAVAGLCIFRSIPEFRGTGPQLLPRRRRTARQRPHHPL